MCMYCDSEYPTALTHGERVLCGDCLKENNAQKCSSCRQWFLYLDKMRVCVSCGNKFCNVEHCGPECSIRPLCGTTDYLCGNCVDDNYSYCECCDNVYHVYNCTHFVLDDDCEDASCPSCVVDYKLLMSFVLQHVMTSATMKPESYLFSKDIQDQICSFLP